MTELDKMGLEAALNTWREATAWGCEPDEAFPSAITAYLETATTSAGVTEEQIASAREAARDALPYEALITLEQGGLDRVVHAVLEASRVDAPVSQNEAVAVAWRWRYSEDADWFFAVSDQRCPDWAEPLYASPSPAGQPGIKADDRLYNADEPMADGEIEMTAAENVLAWLIIEKIGVPDDRNYSPNEAQEILVHRLDYANELENESLRSALHTSPTPVSAPVGESFDMRAHLQRQRDWSGKTFGPGPRTKGVIDHIRKELCEIEADPSDISEWIDVTILALDGAWRAGHTPDQIIAALVAKQVKNEARNWPNWRTSDPNKAIEHVRTDRSPAVEGK